MLMTDHIVVFRQLTIDELSNSINEDKFSMILKDRYLEFLSLCDEVIGRSDIEGVSCYIESGELKFTIKYKEAQSISTLLFDTIL